MMFYREEHNSCQFASLLCSYAILQNCALVFGLHLLLCGTVPGPQHAIHILYVKYDNIFTCKRICWGSGENTVKNIFFLFSTSVWEERANLSAVVYL